MHLISGPKLLLLFSLLLVLLDPFAQADISIDTSIIYFEPGEPHRRDIEVTNASDQPAYVKVEPSVVQNPGTDTQLRAPYTNPKEAGLLVSPNKLIIPPHGRKLVRFVNLQPNGSQERVYRVKIAPVVGELESEQSGIKILIGYEVLVLAHPVNGGPELIARRVGKTLQLENQGNANVLVRDIVQCTADNQDEDQCDRMSGKRLYPGNKLTVSLPYDLPVKLYTSTGLENAIQLVE